MNLHSVSTPSLGATAADGSGSAPRYGFSGHQTFPFRYSWLPKGVQAIRQDPEVFSRPDAFVRLGVGKNMAASIRFWCDALGLICTEGRAIRLDWLGEYLFNKTPPPRFWGHAQGGLSGADPYLEDPGTLWLLHWRLASRPTPASTWYLAFGRWHDARFTRPSLAHWLGQIASSSKSSCRSPDSIRRDVDVFLRTYLATSSSHRQLAEETFDCPLSELGLIRRTASGQFEFVRDSRPSLPPAIFAHALAEFWEATAKDQQTLALERVLFDPGSPGAAFKLDDRSLVQVLEGFPADWGFHYDETAGRRLLTRTAPLAPRQLLERHYGSVH